METLRAIATGSLMATEAREPNIVVAGPQRIAEAAPQEIGAVHRPVIAVDDPPKNVADPGTRSAATAVAKVLVVLRASAAVPAGTVVVRPTNAIDPQVRQPVAGPPAANRAANPPAANRPKAPRPSGSVKRIARGQVLRASRSRLPM